jgi:hypothetical protein
MKKTILYIVLAVLCLNFRVKAQTTNKIIGRVIDSTENKPLVVGSKEYRVFGN